MKSRPGWGPSARAQRGARRRSPTQPRLHRPQPTPPARSATRRARRSVHAAPDAWPIASYHVVCSPSRCPSRKSESGHRKPNSPYPTGHLLLNTPPTPALTADLGQTVTGRHFVPPEGLEPAAGQALATQIIPLALRAWADLTCGPAGRLKPTHDVYLKQWQLSHPTLDFDVVLYDEAQDADPCIADVVEHQTHAQLIAVGDSAQAIYGWRGAGDFLARLDARHRLRLTQSWRFGQAVADEANVWLDMIEADLRVAGNPARQSCLAPLAQPDAVLCRTNAGTIDALLAAHDDQTKAHLIGDGKEMLALARAAERMQQGQPAAHPELVAFRDWAARGGADRGGGQQAGGQGAGRGRSQCGRAGRGGRGGVALGGPGGGRGRAGTPAVGVRAAGVRAAGGEVPA